MGVGGQYRSSDVRVRSDDFSNVTLNPCVDLGAPLSSCTTNPNGPQSFFGATFPRDISSDVKAVFGELKVPITDRFDVQLAARYEWHPAGQTFNPNAALRWKPVDFLTIRGSLGTTYRAPSRQQVDANTVTTTAQAVGLLRVPFDTAGNPDLKPEKATNYGAGILIDVGRFHFSVDYWRYDLRDQIVIENGHRW